MFDDLPSLPLAAAWRVLRDGVMIVAWAAADHWERRTEHSFEMAGVTVRTVRIFGDCLLPREQLEVLLARRRAS